MDDKDHFTITKAW